MRTCARISFLARHKMREDMSRQKEKEDETSGIPSCNLSDG